MVLSIQYLFLTYTFKAIPALLTPVILFRRNLWRRGDTHWGRCGGRGLCADSVCTGVQDVKLGVFKKYCWKQRGTVGTVSITVGCASVIVYISTLERIPTLLGGFIIGITDNRYVFLLICNIMFLILGMIFDNNTITLVFIPMIYPLVQGIWYRSGPLQGSCS